MNGRFLIAAMLAAFLAAGCDRAPLAGATQQEPVSLKVYPVPAERAPAVARALNHLLAGNDNQPAIGRATSVSTGRVLVLAPRTAHDSIADAVEALVEDQPATPATRDTGPVRLRFWFVEARPGPSSRADARIVQLESALAEFERALGQHSFRLTDFFELRVSPARDAAEIRSANETAVTARLSSTEDGWLATISASSAKIRVPTGAGYTDRQSAAHTTTMLEPGALVLLSAITQSQPSGPEGSDRDGEESVQLVLVQAQPQSGQPPGTRDDDNPPDSSSAASPT